MLIGSKAIGTVAYMGGTPAVLEEFTFSLAQMMIYSRETLCNDKQFIHLDRVKFSDHGPARNALASRFLGDFILFLDTDHEFEPDLLVRLLTRSAKHGADVVTGLYRFKTPPCSPVLYAAENETDLRPIARYPNDIDLFRVDAAGAGCLLVCRSVFEVIADTGEGPFDRLPGLSEDHSFFRRLKRLGIPLWAAPDVEAWHLRSSRVTEADWNDEDMTVGEPFAVGGCGR